MEPTSVAPFSSQGLLAAWEDAVAVSRDSRPIRLLAAALPEPGERELWSMPLGVRDSLLLKVYEANYGSLLEGVDNCPRCEEPVEFSTAVGDLLGSVPQLPSAGEMSERELGDWRVHFRAPSTEDLLAAAAAVEGERADPVEVGRHLVRRCVDRAERSGTAVAVGEIDGEALERIAEAQSELDPLAEILLQMRCPECSEEWESLLEVAHFLWRKIDVSARRLLAQLHTLASAYGWSESAILALSPERRGAYLAMIEASRSQPTARSEAPLGLDVGDDTQVRAWRR